MQCIPRIPAILSIIFSSLILVAVWKRPPAVRREPYHRMMFCLSLYDVLGGIWLALGSIPVPEEYGIPGSIGNTQICSAQGFFVHFSVCATNIYNTALVVYFLVKVRYNVHDSTITKWFEPTAHFLAFALSMAAALAGIILQVFNPIGFGGPSNSPLCYIQAFPPGCDFIPGMECTRGANASTVVWYIAAAPQIASTSTILVSLGLVMHTIVVSDRRSRQYQFNNTAKPDEFVDLDPESARSKDVLDAPKKPPTTTSRKNNRSNTSSIVKVVGKRCLLYGAVFLNTFLWTSISMIVHNKEPPEWNSFWLGCMAFIFMPLQGFFNFYIYIAPRYKSLRKENTDKTICWALYHSVHGV